jgi:hypothetical protein
MGDSGSIEPDIDTNSGSSVIRIGQISGPIYEMKTSDDFYRLIDRIFPNGDFYDFDFHVARRDEIRRLHQEHYGNLVGAPPSIEMTRLLGKITVESPNGTVRTIIDPYVKRFYDQKDRNGKFYIGTSIELVENNETTMVHGLRKLTAPPFKIFLPFRTTDPLTTEIVLYEDQMSPVVSSSGQGNTASSGSVISTLNELQTRDIFLRILTNIFGSLDNVKDYVDVLDRRQEIIEYRRTHPNTAGEPPEIEMTRLIGRIIKITPDGTRTVFYNPYIKLCGNTIDDAGNITGTTFNFVESKEEGEITNSEGRRVLRLIAPQMVI